MPQKKQRTAPPKVGGKYSSFLTRAGWTPMSLLVSFQYGRKVDPNDEDKFFREWAAIGCRHSSFNQDCEICVAREWVGRKDGTDPFPYVNPSRAAQVREVVERTPTVRLNRKLRGLKDGARRPGQKKGKEWLFDHFYWVRSERTRAHVSATEYWAEALEMNPTPETAAKVAHEMRCRGHMGIAEAGVYYAWERCVGAAWMAYRQSKANKNGKGQLHVHRFHIWDYVSETEKVCKKCGHRYVEERGGLRGGLRTRVWEPNGRTYVLPLGISAIPCTTRLCPPNFHTPVRDTVGAKPYIKAVPGGLADRCFVKDRMEVEPEEDDADGQ